MKGLHTNQITCSVHLQKLYILHGSVCSKIDISISEMNLLFY